MISDKRGQFWPVVLLIGGFAFLVLLIAGMTIGWGVVKSATDVIIPEFNSIGEVSPGVNISEYTEMSLTPMDSIIDNFGLMMGLIYIIGLVGLMSFAFIFRNNYNGWVVAFFIVTILLLVMICIFISNYYEEFYLGQDELGLILRAAPLVSFFIIQSPAIMSIMGFVAGLILFTGSPEEGYNV